MNQQKTIDRRTFIKTTAAGCASIALTSSLACNSQSDDLPSDLSAEVSTKAKASEKVDQPAEALAKEGAPKGSMPTRPLGRTGISVPILGLGGDIDWTINQSLLRMAYNMGITLWDTGNAYQNGKSEIGYGQYFNKYPDDRKNIFLISKASWDKVDPAGLSEHLNLSLERLQTDYIDLYGMHSITEPKALTPEIKAWAEQKKKEGKIRLFGFSAHKNMATLLARSADLGWVDVVISTYNYQVASQSSIKKAMEKCSKAGVGMIAMKSQGIQYNIRRGLYTFLPADRSVIDHFTEKGYSLPQAKLKAIWENDKIASSLSHITNLTILKENVTAATDNVRLTSDDMTMFNKLAEMTCGYYCSGCARCEKLMEGTMISDVLRYMMYYNGYGKKDEARKLFGEIPSEIRDTMLARNYSTAEAVCPNRIKIGRAMKEAAILLA